MCINIQEPNTCTSTSWNQILVHQHPGTNYLYINILESITYTSTSRNQLLIHQHPGTNNLYINIQEPITYTSTSWNQLLNIHQHPGTNYLCINIQEPVTYTSTSWNQSLVHQHPDDGRRTLRTRAVQSTLAIVSLFHVTENDSIELLIANIIAVSIVIITCCKSQNRVNKVE